MAYRPRPYSKAEYARNRVKLAARKRIGYLASTGVIPRARSLSCVDCGGPAKEYDHHRGYEGDAAVDVQAVCKPCHGRRGSERGEHRGPTSGPRIERIRSRWTSRTESRRWQSVRMERIGFEPLLIEELWVAERDSYLTQLADVEAAEMAHVAFADAASLVAA